MPARIQLKRSAGYRKPPEAIVVARPSVWGNPFRIQRRPDAGSYIVAAPGGGVTGIFPTKASAAEFAVALYRQNVHLTEAQLLELHGRDLACWCPPGQPCHADVLLEWANPEPEQADLFGGAFPDPEPDTSDEPPPGLGKDARRTWRQRRQLENGIHPATGLVLIEHDPTIEPKPPTCGTCEHLWFKSGDFRFRGWKCAQAAARGLDGPDVRKKWPACIAYTPADGPHRVR